MAADDPKVRLNDTTFLLGGFRRRAAIKALAESPDPSGVVTLGRALDGLHPDAERIAAVLGALSPQRDGPKVAALWAEWAEHPKPSLAGVLSRVGPPEPGSIHPKLARAVLAVPTKGAAPEVTQAIEAFAPGFSVLTETGDSADLTRLTAALNEAHQCAATIDQVLRGLSGQRQGKQIVALWDIFIRSPKAPLAGVLASLGWPAGHPVSREWARAVLAIPARAVVPEVAKAISALAATLSVLAESDDPRDVLVLAEALNEGHPCAAGIGQSLRALSPHRQGKHIAALWNDFIGSPKSPLAAVLASLGWPAGSNVTREWARTVLAVPTRQAGADVARAIAALAPTLSVLAESDDPRDVLLLAEALNEGHPCGAGIGKLLKALSQQRQHEHIAALWAAFAGTPRPPLAAVLAALGWPAGHAAGAKTIRALFALPTPAADPNILAAVTAFARALPAADEAANDALYGAWIRSQSPALEALITEQRRQPGSPVLEALHALVTGRAERYAALDDADGMLLVQAYAMAPEPFRARIEQAVAASSDRKIMAAYRRARGGGADAAQIVDSLKRVGDEDGVFEASRSLRLAGVLELCERWSTRAGRPAGARQSAAVERALAAYRGLGRFEVEPGPPLPEGLVDIFDWWRAQKPTDAELRADLDAPDPFQKARGLYLGRERGVVDDQRLRAAATSDHWPERMVARLLDPSLLAQGAEDHVFWVTACAVDASLLNTPIHGTPEDYARHTALLGQARGAAAARTRALMEILCAFQGAFVASGITVDGASEAAKPGSIELEPAPRQAY